MFTIKAFIIVKCFTGKPTRSSCKEKPCNICKLSKASGAEAVKLNRLVHAPPSQSKKKKKKRILRCEKCLTLIYRWHFMIIFLLLSGTGIPFV